MQQASVWRVNRCPGHRGPSLGAAHVVRAHHGEEVQQLQRPLNVPQRLVLQRDGSDARRHLLLLLLLQLLCVGRAPVLAPERL